MNKKTTDMHSKKEKSLFFRGFYVEIVSRVTYYFTKTLKNPNWFLMSVLGRFQLFRFIAVALAKSPNFDQYQSKAQFSSGFNNLNPKQAAEILKKEGLYQGIYLPDILFKEILDFAHSTPCYGNLDPKLGFLYSEKEKYDKKSDPFLTAQYFNTKELCPAIQTLANDPKLLEIAARYLGAEPVCTGSRLWWNFVVDEAIPYDPNKTITFFHYDLDDYACLRFFFYLTDVGKEGGAHVVVPGSHVKKNLSHILVPVKRRTDQQIFTYYGSENVIRLSGKAGFGFAEDTFCYHKATRPRDKDRLMLQIQFAVYDYGVQNDIIDPSFLAQIE
jgi:hypothetical protein